MPTIDYDKLQDSLERIKMVCEDCQESTGCEGCPLGDRLGDCMVKQMYPKDWRVRHPKTDAFRVLA